MTHRTFRSWLFVVIFPAVVACGSDSQLLGERVPSGGSAGTDTGGSGGTAHGGSSGAGGAGGAGATAGTHMGGGAGSAGSAGSAAGGDPGHGGGDAGASGEMTGGASGSHASGDAGEDSTGGVGGIADAAGAGGVPGASGSDSGAGGNDGFGATCNSGCTMGASQTELCPDSVFWECGPDFDQQPFNDHCADTGTAFPRYCCPAEFIFEQYPGCALM